LIGQTGMAEKRWKKNSSSLIRF